MLRLFNESNTSKPLCQVRPDQLGGIDEAKKLLFEISKAHMTGEGPYAARDRLLKGNTDTKEQKGDDEDGTDKITKRPAGRQPSSSSSASTRPVVSAAPTTTTSPTNPDESDSMALLDSDMLGFFDGM